MTKKAALSGILPRPRPILPKRKTFWEIEAEKKEKQGFADPEMIPKKVQATWTPKHEKSASERIAHSAKEPTKPKKQNTELQKWKAMTSDIRRTYFKDTLTSQEKRDINSIKRREEQYNKAKEARLQIDQTEESEATRLTLPTIDAFLNQGQFIQPRTAEEREKLQLERKANRLFHQIKHQKQKAASLLELYQQSKDYIVTEAELDAKIDKEFQTVTSSRPAPWADYNKTEPAQAAQQRLKQELLGTTSNNKPGLPQVEDVLAGKQ